MNRLFVDCDDTLILWDNAVEHKDGAGPLYHGDRYEVNAPLVDAVKTWQEANHDGAVIVWSGGGADYASRWMRLVGVGALAISKDIAIPTDGDVCVDDQPINVSSVRLTPDEFIAEMRP